MSNETHRQCSKCQQTKPLDEQHYHWRKDQQCYRRVCRSCRAEGNKNASHAWYQRNKTRKRAQSRMWYEAHEEEMKQYRREYRANNREAITAYDRAWKRERFATDPEYRLKVAMRTRVADAVRRNGTGKARPSLALVGATPSELRAYLESRFYGGMTWDTFGYGPGKWQIDHITPIGLFDLTFPSAQWQAFHYTNLQPLWWEDHQTKTRIDNMRIRNVKEIRANLWTHDQLLAASASV